MAPRRFRRTPEVICSPRSFLESSACDAVDAALKDLKNCGRKLQSLLVSHGDEVRLLERLYYKGKNQHRSALFWNRLEEVRKYGKRLQELELLNLFELLRCSFFGLAVVANPKALKGPWTHYPDSRCVIFIMERISSCLFLLMKSHRQLAEAYRFFVVSMQSGYFVQLVLTITSITSRLDILAMELQPVLSDWHRTSTALLSSLHVGLHNLRKVSFL
ncbi:hypothetical protein NEOLEDRAFT_1063278 [Neolentinus lepideus HHB14362 ss-1]|uniref:Nucleolus and neural progenitor protein-like N-terminal domain-containing protein n=1 Tax=Neolentinus lepideus HHB14362 ss-1 TaxID=1314782 RepID=A0A165T792_9AGAM|nr:hypothetical protein NEOLEDRAFT_1063278 [Neolentinus lepideus HHB14362 ss-1]